MILRRFSHVSLIRKGMAKPGDDCPLAPFWSSSNPTFGEMLRSCPALGLATWYPVNWQFAMENHHFKWLNQLFLWPFSIANCQFTRGYPQFSSIFCRDFPWNKPTSYIYSSWYLGNLQELNKEFPQGLQQADQVPMWLTCWACWVRPVATGKPAICDWTEPFII